MQSTPDGIVNRRTVTTHDLSRLWHTICIDTSNKARIQLDFSADTVDSPCVILQWVVPEEVGDTGVIVDHVYAQRLYRHNANSISFGALFDFLIDGRGEFYRSLPLWSGDPPAPGTP